jgi:hypothetical protein
MDKSPKGKGKTTDTSPQTRDIKNVSNQDASASPKPYERFTRQVGSQESPTMSLGDRNARKLLELMPQVFPSSIDGVRGAGSPADADMSEAASLTRKTADTYSFTYEDQFAEQSAIENESRRSNRVIEDEIKTIEQGIKAEKDKFQDHVKSIFPELFSLNEVNTTDPVIEEAKNVALSLLEKEIKRRCKIDDIIVSIEKNRFLNNNIFNNASREILNIEGSPTDENMRTRESITRMAVYEPAGQNASKILELHAKLEALGEKYYERSIIDFDRKFIHFLQSENIYRADEETTGLLRDNITILEETRSHMYSKYEIYKKYESK